MVFKCQKDSFLREWHAQVVACEAICEPLSEYGHTREFSGYAVELDDTILFPAGGGQPHDHGFLDTERVLQVIRRGPRALHFVEKSLTVGAVVTQTVDWTRRFDHMQQHSGQHLLSAILEKDHLLRTSSWWLGQDESYVELDSVEVTPAVLEQVQNRCNELIREALPVTVTITSSQDPSLDQAHTRGLPEDCDSEIRVIGIGDIDQNMCCGTHVSNLSQLQCIKLIGSEPGKKGKINVRFLVGDRVLRTFALMQQREAKLTGLLKNDPTRHEELVQKLQKNFKFTSKNLQNVLGELAECEIEKLKRSDPRPPYLCLYKKESTAEFNRAICKGLENEGVFVFVAAEDPDRPKEGQIIIQGPEEHCAALGSKITELLKGKGMFKNGKFQGKVADMSAVPKCKKLVEEYFSKLRHGAAA